MNIGMVKDEGIIKKLSLKEDRFTLRDSFIYYRVEKIMRVY